jgi:hypothetical protein
MRFTVRIVQQVKLVPTIETTIVLLVVFWCSKMENGLILSVLPLSSSSMFYSSKLGPDQSLIFSISTLGGQWPPRRQIEYSGFEVVFFHPRTTKQRTLN